jgi:hypothetical protein
MDFCQPISLSEYSKFKMAQDSNFDPFANKNDQMLLNEWLAHDIVYDLQRNLRMMPTTLVAAIMLLYRKGISEAELEQKVGWLGMIIGERGTNHLGESGLPGKGTVKLGLDHLRPYIDETSGIFQPRVTADP